MTRYADGLLADGERVVLRARQHWLAPVLEGRWAILMIVASFALLWLRSGMGAGDALATVVGWAVFLLLVGGLGWLGFIYLGWSQEDYLVTTRRVLKVEGVLSKRSADSSLEKINDAVLEQSLLGRMLGYGDLEILTASEQSVDRYHRLAGAPAFKRTMLDAKHRLEQESVEMPGPPLRTRPAPMGSPAAGGWADGPSTPPPAGPGPARAMTAAEITQALRDLAELRDRGAVTPEEFEAKKRDLLGRL